MAATCMSTCCMVRPTRLSWAASRPYSLAVALPKYAYRAKQLEIEESAFNVNIPRFVDTSEAEEEFALQSLARSSAAWKASTAAERRGKSSADGWGSSSAGPKRNRPLTSSVGSSPS